MKRNIILFKALSNQTRYKILELLMEGEKCVCEIFPYVKRTQSTVSIQLGKLDAWGLLESRRDGKNIYYKLKNHTLCDIFRAVKNKKRKILKKECCMCKGK